MLTNPSHKAIALKAKIQQVRGEFVSYAQFEEIANEFDSVLQKLHSDGTKKVKAAKDQKKLDSNEPLRQAARPG